MGKKVVFYGCGNMGEGILRSVLDKKVLEASDILVKEVNEERCQYLNYTYGVAAGIEDAREAVKAADLVLLAVVPKLMGQITQEISDMVSDNTIVMSVAAGVTIEAMEANLGQKKIVRVMPNTLNQTGYGYSAVCVNDQITEEDKVLVTAILDSLGKTMYIQEGMFGAFTAFSCSGPMWIYKMASELTDAGVYVGFHRSEAEDIVLNNLMGVAKVLEMTGDSPAERVAEMCSPAGVTVEGLKVLNDGGFGPAIVNSVAQAVDKADRVGKK